MDINNTLGLIGLMFAHFVGDFVLQTDEMALNKSSSIPHLLYHVVVYGIPIFIFCFVFDFSYIVLWVNVVSHFIIDFVTSRITKHLWAKGDRHNFFVVIGFDQLLHTAIIVWSFFLAVKC